MSPTSSNAQLSSKQSAGVISPSAGALPAAQFETALLPYFVRIFRETTHLPPSGPDLVSVMNGALSLAGEWIGYYPGHFDEVVRIEQRGDEVEAIKITGDDYVPAGAVTWRARLSTLSGEGQIAEREFQNPRFIPGKLRIINSERIIFKWEQCGEVEFRRDD